MIIADEIRFRLEKGRKSILSYPPRSLTLTIAGACTFRCVFCVNHCPDAQLKETTRKLYKLPFKLSIDEFNKVLEWAHNGRIPNFHICSAGEPFLHKQIFNMIDSVIDKYGDVSFQTDFAEIVFDDGKYLDLILDRKKYIKYITTDLLSGDASVHNEMKKGSDLIKVLDYMQYLSSKSEIIFDVHHILTKKNYKNLYHLPRLLMKKNIKFRIASVNLHPYGFNEWTSIDNVYNSNDVSIRNELDQFSSFCKKNKIAYSVPLPFDSISSKCGVFWSRIQIIPVKDLPKNRWKGNVIPGYCNACVNGGLNSIGNIFDHSTVMDFWNNETIVKIRKDLLRGKYPDKACESCQNHV